MAPQEQENAPENRLGDSSADNPVTPATSAKNKPVADIPKNADSERVRLPVKSESAPAEIKPDLLSLLQEKDAKNREDGMLKVIFDAKNLLKDAIIPPVKITPFEEKLLNFVIPEFWLSDQFSPSQHLCHRLFIRSHLESRQVAYPKNGIN